jgi:hypothetical protein
MSDDNQKLYPWSDGLPTKPDVDLLLKTWPEPKVGDRFEYEAVETILHQKRDTARFKTITNKWRDRLCEQGFTIECEAGKAFYVATCGQISAATYGVLRGVGRKARKHRIKLSIAKPVDDAERSVVEHQARLMGNVERDAKKARMNLLQSTAVPVTPQIAPPKKKGNQDQHAI